MLLESVTKSLMAVEREHTSDVIHGCRKSEFQRKSTLRNWIGHKMISLKKAGDVVSIAGIFNYCQVD